MKFVSTQKFVVMSPRKLGEIADLVKKMSPTDALVKLPFINKRGSNKLQKVIKTAVANAKQKNVNETDLVIEEIQINQGPRLKRFRAGARGRAKPYKRRMSHIRVVLKTINQDAKESKKKKTSDTKVEVAGSREISKDDKKVGKTVIKKKGDKSGTKS